MVGVADCAKDKRTVMIHPGDQLLAHRAIMSSCGLPIVCSPLGTELIRFVRIVQILHFCLLSLKYSLKTLAFHVLDCYVGIGHVDSQEYEDTAD